MISAFVHYLAFKWNYSWIIIDCSSIWNALELFYSISLWQFIILTILYFMKRLTFMCYIKLIYDECIYSARRLTWAFMNVKLSVRLATERMIDYECRWWCQVVGHSVQNVNKFRLFSFHAWYELNICLILYCLIPTKNWQTALWRLDPQLI